MITAYRLGDGSVTSNRGTVWRQQYDYFMSRDIGTEVKKFDPRKKMIQDLEATIEKYQDTENKVILMLDANEDRKKLTGYAYGAMVERLEMMPVLDETEETVLPSTITGKKVIDHIELLGIDTTTVVRRGQLPHGIGFDTDHRAMYIDLDTDQLFGLSPDKMNDTEGRRLKSENKEYSAIYTKALFTSLTNQNVFPRLTRL